MNTSLKPRISEHLDYRAFLNSMYNYLKIEKPGFSYRSFAKAAGLNSPSFLKLVMDGKRNLTDESIEKFAHAFMLNQEESEYFRTLVKYNQSGSTEEKMRNYKWLQKLKGEDAQKALNNSPEQEFWDLWFATALKKAKEEGHRLESLEQLEAKFREIHLLLSGAAVKPQAVNLQQLQ